MKYLGPLWTLSPLLLIVCTSTDSVDDIFPSKLAEFDSTGKLIRSMRDGSRTIGGRGIDVAAFSGTVQTGTDKFVSYAGPQVAVGTMAKGGEGYSLDLVNALMAAVAKNVLGDVLKVNYVVIPRVTGTLTLQTTAPEFQHIQQILKQLDTVPTQVLLEPMMAEVTLNDELKFGPRWAFENGNFGVGLSDVASGFAGASFPGFNWSYATRDIRVTLNALSSVTDVNVVSAPTLMALNNQKAVLQIGDQVPIATQQSQGGGNGNAPIMNSVELKDTGIILSVTPRVNNSGRVMLDIQQEVSDVVNTTSSGIDSPTIQQRRINTKVSVNNNETLALGGLIQQKNSLTHTKVPLLGNAFKNKTDTIKKTELIIFIKPRTVRDVNEARDVTEEFRRQLNFTSTIQNLRGGKNEFQQAVKRQAC